MEEYLKLWWSGEVAQYYSFYGLSILQLNKIAKISQYLIGLLSVFELIQFSRLMKQFKIVTYTYFWLNKLPWAVISNSLSLVPKLGFGGYLLLKKEITKKEFFNVIIREQYIEAVEKLNQSADKSIIVKTFRWLADNPMPDNHRRFILFFSFAVFSAIEIFTS